MKRTVVTLSAVSLLSLAAACMPEDRAEDVASARENPASGEKRPAEASSPQSEQDFSTLLESAPGSPTALQPLSTLPMADVATSRARGVAGIIADDHVLPRIHEPRDDRERYEDVDPHPVKLVRAEPVSTFSIDVDTASYANVRRYLMDGVLPPENAVRVEELINYFDYAYPAPADADQPFATDIALFDSPWDGGSQLLRIGIQGRQIEVDSRPPANLVFLLDTSGSMADPDKLPLLQRSLGMLVDDLRPQDSIAIVAYAGSAGVVLEPTPGSEKATILHALDHLQAGGSTAGADGIDLAYRLAESGFEEGAVNRVILATDGDFNVGISDPGRLEDYIARERESGVYLSILGFGRGNLNDLLMQKLAQAGNGNASYIDSLMEARKVLVDEMGSTLFPIADDVKVQIEFNPKRVAEYRLIGYETRMLAREDFNNDHIDAGEIGSGHTVTALYEITPVDSPSRLVDDLRYGIKPAAAIEPSAGGAGEVAWLRLRYKRPGEGESQLVERPVMADAATAFDDAGEEARFAAAVAAFGQILRRSPHVLDIDLDAVLDIAAAARGGDPFGYRAEFLQLVRLAKSARALEPVNG